MKGTKREQIREQKREREGWRPPRGIRYKLLAGRPSKPFQLLWREDGGDRTQCFADACSREDAAKALAEKRSDFGREVLTFDPKEWRLWQLFKERIGGADPLLVAQEWLESRRALGRMPGGVTVARAVESYLRSRQEEKLARDTYRHLESHLAKRLALTHGARPLTDLTADEIRKWLASLKSGRGDGTLGPVARRHHQKTLKTFLDFCVRETWIARNPALALGLPKVFAADPELLTPAQGRLLFEKNQDCRVIGRLALEAFGGQRFTTAAQILKDDLRFEEKGLRLRAVIHKSQRTHYRQGYPENLWAWLRAAPESCWEMSGLEYRNEKRDAFVRAGIGNSDNRLRKTFASAHLAAFRNQPLTSYLMQHSNTSTTDVYLGIMSESDAKAWFSILPG